MEVETIRISVMVSVGFFFQQGILILYCDGIIDFFKMLFIGYCISNSLFFLKAKK